MRYLILISFTLLFMLPASAQVYRWVDEQGKVHYGDMPPPEENAQALTIDSGERVSADGDDDADDSDGDNDAAADEKTPAAQSLAEKRCELAKLTLDRYRSAETLVKTDEEGNKQTLNEEETARAIKQAEATVAARCNTDG